MLSAPDIPTVDEAGLPGFHVLLWSGMWAPKGTPKDVDRASSTRRCAKRSPIPAVLKRFGDLGLEATPAQPPDAGSVARAPEGRGRQVVAGDQGRRSEAGGLVFVQTAGKFNEACSACYLCRADLRDRRCGAVVSVAAGHDHRAVSGGRTDRHAGAHLRGQREGPAGPAGDRRERRGCGRQHRHRPRCRLGARRLHAEPRQLDQPRRRRRDLSGQLAHSPGPRAGGETPGLDADDRRQERPAGQEHQGADRLDEGQSRQGVDRQRRQRQRRARLLGLLQ